MTYLPDIGKHYKIKFPSKFYKWSCESEPNRQIQLFGGKDHDVLTKCRVNTYNCHTGVMKVNIHIPDEDVVLVKKDKRKLVLI